MSDYLLLTTPYNPHVIPTAFSSTPPFLQTAGALEDDYDHTDFGFYVDDDKKALAHAAGIIQKLNAIRDGKIAASKSNILQLKNALEEDYKNYLACIQYSSMGNRKTVREFTECLFSFGMDKQIFQNVQKYFQETQVDNDEVGLPYARWTLLDFDDLYIRAGDCALFLHNDTASAFALYNLAALMWEYEEHASSRYLPDMADNDVDDTNNSNTVTRDEADDAHSEADDNDMWQKKVALYKQLATGYRLDISSAIPEADEKIRNLDLLYNDLLAAVREHKTAETILEKTNAFFTCLSSVTSEQDVHTKRIIHIISQAVRKKCVLPVLYCLAKEPSSIRNAYRGYADMVLPYLQGTRFARLRRLFSCPGKKDFDKLLNFVSAAKIADDIEQELRIKDSDWNGKPAYYTSIDTFSYMLPDACTGKKADRCGKLTVMHLSYMNDPTEGIVAKRYIYGKKISQKKISERKNISVPYVFLKCFTAQIDYLPMWEMYGDHAQGCCLVLDWKKTISQTAQNAIPLYQVCYVNKGAERYSVRKTDNPNINTRIISARLKELQAAARHITENEQDVFDSLLGLLPYLFKDNSYSYEQELRILYSFENADSVKFKQTEQTPPKLFVLTDFPVQIQEIIFGPKCGDTANKIPYYQSQIEKMCRKTNMEMPSLTFSDIDYR